MTVPLKTKRNDVHYGDEDNHFGIPVANVKGGKRTDYLTAWEFVEDLYKKKVKQITFEDDTSISPATLRSS